MYPIPANLAALFDANQRQTLRMTGTDADGNTIVITDANMMINSFSIDRYCCNSSRLEIGTAVAAQMTCRLDNSEGAFNGVRFEGMEFLVEIGIADWTQDNPEIHYIPCGVFIPDEQPRMRTIVTLNALDRMMYFDAIPPTLSPWTTQAGTEMRDQSGNILYFVADLVFPCTLESLVQQTAVRCNVPFTQDISSLPNSQYVISEIPKLRQDVTFRNLIQWAAALMGTNAFIDWSGELRFAFFGDTGYNSTMNRRYSSDMQENDIRLTGISYTVDGDEEDTTYLAGNEGYVLDLSSNALIGAAADISTILINIWTPLNNFTYRPFEATVKPAPWLFPMDRVTFTDAQGNGHVSILTNVNFGLNACTQLASRGETAQTNKYVAPSGLTQQQQRAIERVQRVTLSAVQQAVDQATEDITGAKDSHVRLIYDSSGGLQEILIMDTDDIATAVKVWRWNSGGLGYSRNGYAGPYTTAITQSGSIVADFITTGILNANLIRTGIITGENGGTQFDLNQGIIKASSSSNVVEIEDGRVAFYFPSLGGDIYIGAMRTADYVTVPDQHGAIEINSEGYVDLRSMVDGNEDVTTDTARLFLQEGLATLSATTVTVSATDLNMNVTGRTSVNGTQTYDGTFSGQPIAIVVENGLVMNIY